MPDKDRIEEDGVPKWTVVHGTQAGKLMQTRFKRMPDSHLSKETVAGIRDMNLGRVKPDGSRVGAPIIRFDSGQNTGAHPHININAGGRRSASAPHIEVPEGVIRAADVVNRTLKYAGIGLTVCAVAIDAWRLGTAVTDDLYIREHADEIIIELEDSIKELKKLLETESSSKRRQQIKETIEHLMKILRDVMRSKKILLKTIKTTSSIAAGWGAGAVGAYGGALAGAQVGTAVGTCFGPVGPVVGAPVGATIGAISAAICAGTLGSHAAEYVADKALDTFVEP